jgi:3-oxoacyl-[acyl-carrier-protein] synthase-3
MYLQGARITAIGTYVPEGILTNQELENRVETSDEWIVQRTGIQERRVSRKDEYTSDLCYEAVQNLIQRYGKSVHDVDMILVATSTAELAVPSVASQLQHRLGIGNATGAIDLSAACAGFTYALHMAHSFIRSGLHRKILVLGAETLTKVTDYTDRTTCILFGDGAGAVLVEKDESLSSSFLAFHLSTEGSGGAHVYQTRLANRLNGTELVDSRLLVQNGREVYRWAVRTIPSGIQQLLQKSGIEANEINWFIPHSANLRMIEPICEKSGIPLDRTLVSLVHYGNTSAASIPLALDLGIRDGRVQNGDTALLYGFGGGLVQAGLLLRLQLDPQL